MIDRLPTLLCAALLVATPALARAQILPPPNFSTIDPIGVGDNTGRAIGGSPAGFDVSVRDANNQPVPGAVVTLHFAGTGVRAYAVQAAGTTVDAGLETLSRVATTGSANFAARTGGYVNANQVGVDGNGVSFGNVKWRSTDIDGQGGTTGLADFAYFAGKFIAGAVAPECNFDLSGSDVPGLGDYTIFANEYLVGPPGAYAW